MEHHVRRLEDVRAGDTGTAGGKAAHLGELAAHGFPVPPGFVVSALACREFFEAIGLSEMVPAFGERGAAGLLSERCGELRRRVVGNEMSAPLAEAILAAHTRLVAGRSDVVCAVRSSATAEDQAGASFAGQHGTYYHVEAASLLEMIRHCWASLWSPEAVSYRASHNIPHAGVFMAVVVQEMVRSEVSGVSFTANPVTGDRGEIVIESSWGMGAAIVDGRVTPDRYVVGREGLTLREQRIAEKRFMVPARLPSAATERMVAVPQAQQRRETLTPEQVRTIASWSLECEQHFGAPQDVEWAITDGRFHLLQSRPITTLGRDEGVGDLRGAYVLFKPLAENFTDPLTPLSSSLLMSSMPFCFRLIRGRVYFDLKYLRPIIPLAISDEDLARALYLNIGHKPLDFRLSLLKLPLALATGLAMYLFSGHLLARTRGMPDDFMDGYRALCQRVESDSQLDPKAAFLRLFMRPRPFEPVGHMAVLVNGSSLRFAPWMALLQKMLRRWAPDLRPDAVAFLCSGSEGVLSAEMGRSLWALAATAKRVPRVQELLAGPEPEEALAQLRKEPLAREFLTALDSFLAVHGHRAVKEFELQSPRWAENPAPVLGMARNYLSAGPDRDPSGQAGAAVRAELESEIARALSSLPLERRLGLRRRLIGLAARRARYYLKLRENSRFYHIMAIGSVRKKILAIEASLLREGRLKCKDDIFFLLWDEVDALAAGRLSWTSVENRIRERRLEHARFAKLTPPKTVGITTRRPEPDVDTADGHALRGQCASPGRYVGIARVILDPSVDATLRPGEVLIAPYTDPAWTPLFLTAGAAVVEVGSYLSHAGTVAREFGMPCLVDVADCTRRIQTGTRVDVDADRGLVHVLDAGGGT